MARPREVELIDATKPVREGEELDLERLRAWLARQGLAADGLAVEQFPRGHSNLTYLVRAGGQELVLRRPPIGSKVKSAHDMGREVRILTRLAPLYPQAPRIVAFCDDSAVIGAPFLLMQRMSGVILRGPTLKVALAPERVRALCESFVDTLAALHAVDWRAAGLEGHPEGYVRRQVEGWTRRWSDSKTDEIPEVDEIAGWLAARLPPERGAALIHNDFKYDNLVLDPADPARIVGVLDWEMSTVGDPLMDLGTALGYWIEEGDDDALKSFAFGPTFAPGSLTRRELAARYGERTGRDVSGILFYYCFALFKTAVVAQQIYARFKAGLTRDERFASFIFGVQLLSQQAVRAAQAGAF
jgi:aminoglycoside phosphotransferase (APT) family kinase protein